MSRSMSVTFNPDAGAVTIHPGVGGLLSSWQVYPVKEGKVGQGLLPTDNDLNPDPVILQRSDLGAESQFVWVITLYPLLVKWHYRVKLTFIQDGTTLSVLDEETKRTSSSYLVQDDLEANKPLVLTGVLTMKGGQ